MDIFEGSLLIGLGGSALFLVNNTFTSVPSVELAGTALIL